MITLAMYSAACAPGKSWRSETGSYLRPEHRLLLGKVRIVRDEIELNDCLLCFATRRTFSESCARVDETGLVYKSHKPDLAWLRELECSTPSGNLRHEFPFPYLAVDVVKPESIFYIGHIDIVFKEANAPSVRVSENLSEILEELKTRQRALHPLPIYKALLKRQADTWGERQKTR